MLVPRTPCIVTAVAACLVLLTLTAAVGAEVLEAPVGGKAIALPDEQLACGNAGGWEATADRHFVRPPLSEDRVGQPVDLVVARSAEACADSKARVTLIANGAWPSFDPQGAVAFVDDGRVEVRGKHLHGIRMQNRDGAPFSDGACEPALADGNERCSFNVGYVAQAGAPNVPVTWLPAGASGTVGETFFDADGKPAAPERFRLNVTRLAVATLVSPGASIDALGATAAVPLRHPEVVAAVDCAPAFCALEGGTIVVGSLPVGVTSVAIRVRLVRGVVLRRGDATEVAPLFRVPVLRCPMSVVSGAPLRDVDNQKVVLKIEGRCTADTGKLRFQVAGYQADRLRDVAVLGSTYVVLRLPQIDTDEVTLYASRDEGDDFVVAQVRVKTRAVPQVRVTLEIPERGSVDFLPTNLEAVARASSPTWDGTLTLVPVDGLYGVRTQGSTTFVRGVSDAVGSVALRVALRSRTLPQPLADLDVAVVSDASVRAVRDASIPFPLDATVHGGRFVELLCDRGDGKASVVPPGVLTHIPFERRDSCRLVVHTESLDAGYGTQKLVLEADVTAVDGTPRAEARISRTLTFVAGSKTHTLWLHGAQNRFDRISIRLSHAADERHYVGATDTELGLPSEQWTVVTGVGKARIYATSAIPTGLYRVSDRAHSGLLTLNFGVLAKLTWLDSLGHEGLLDLEGGVMAVGLANDVSSSGRSLTQVATVVGIGFSVPIANRALTTETAINLHAWYEWEPSRALGDATGSASAFVFGPSISVGNIGADL